MIVRIAEDLRFGRSDNILYIGNFIMSALYIERANMSGNGGMDQSQNPGAQAQRTNQGTPNGGMNSSAQTPQSNPQNPTESPSAGRDYRDDLRELLDRAHSERGLTRYRLCKQMGIDSGTLSNVLAKRRHFSLEKLEQILGLLGYRLSFTQGEAPAGNGGANGVAANGSGAARPM